MIQINHSQINGVILEVVIIMKWKKKDKMIIMLMIKTKYKIINKMNKKKSLNQMRYLGEIIHKTVKQPIQKMLLKLNRFLMTP